ncbi:MAG: methylaspartate mutase subunit E [Deltaproteobacteria bacterium]|nr:methylaspartate mutase subunit E [Deltaproteobacteria bacterium]
MEIRNRRLSDEEFARERRRVLATWPTGREVDLDEAVEFHRSMGAHKNFARKLLDVRQRGATTIRSDSGVPTVEEFSAYLKYLQVEGQADFLGTMVDSLTRYQKYEAAEGALQEGLRSGRWALNGFPIVTHGVHGTRRVVEAVDLPVLIRGVAPDYRLIDEIGLAGGHTGSTGNILNTFCQYTRKLSLETVVGFYQYAYRLMGTYEERGIPMTASINGGFGILCPFGVLIAGAILDSIIAAEQGVKHFNLTINCQGNVVQDVAAVLTLRRSAEAYLQKLGYRGTTVTINCTNWSGRFPADVFQACALISLGVYAAILGRCEIAHVKTIEEAKTIPTREANAASLRLGKTVITLLEDQCAEFDAKTVEAEASVLKREVEAIVDTILDAGSGDAVLGELRAVETGLFDVPFATSQNVHCRVKGVRDRRGMVRYLDHGRLPLPQEIVSFHREKIREREREEGRAADYQMIIEDLSSLGDGFLRRKTQRDQPLSST